MVGDLVGQMGQEGSARGEQVDDLQGSGDVKVPGMGGIAERVDNQSMDSLEERERGVRDGAAVGEICQVVYPVAGGADGSMKERHRSDSAAEEVEGEVDDPRIQERRVAGAFQPLENIGKGPAELMDGLGCSVAGDKPFVDIVKAAEVIYAVDVVGMGMSEEDRVDGAYPFAEHLPAEIGGGVQEDVLSGITLDQQGTACPVVTRFP